MSERLTSEQFRQQWLSDIVAGDPSTLDLGRRFAYKLILQWLDIADDSDDLILCDGAGDGGIDIAYLQRSESIGKHGSMASDDASTPEGDTWFLVQSKYGAAFQGSTTLLAEAQKVLETLAGNRPRLSSLAEGLIERLRVFIGQASDRDRIVLVYATEDPLSEEQVRTLEHVRAMGRSALGTMFDVETVSIETIFKRTVENEAPTYLRIPMKADLVTSGENLLVGTVPLHNLYDFLKAYRLSTQDLDRLYEKNVRRFLGVRGHVNRAMRDTLLTHPELFGLYNNGITIVVAESQQPLDGAMILHDPYIVNGCQTTRTIWEVFSQRMEAGGTGHNEQLEQWKDRAAQGVVVVKIVKVGAAGAASLPEITRYTNSQNAVREKDFIALTSDFKMWSEQMASKYGVYLEIQRGGWDSRRALQAQHPQLQPQFSRHANAFDLIKVLGAGWLTEAGLAFGKNGPFLPGGEIFKRIVGDGDDGEAFGVDDLYAAFLLQTDADEIGFGRHTQKASRRQTRFLFYMVVVELLKDILIRANLDADPRAITRAILSLHQVENAEPRRLLLEQSIELIDEYLNQQMEDALVKEPAFQREFNNDINAYLKWVDLGKSENSSPRLRSLLGKYRLALGIRGQGGLKSARELITSAILAPVLAQ